MPPPETPKVKIKIKARFTDEQGGRLYGPGEWDVDPAVSMRLIASGKATLVGAKAATPATKPTGDKAPPANPRIPPAPPTEEVVDTQLPDDFPLKEALVAAGFDTVEKLKAPDVKDALGEVKELTPADITKIGLAISKI